jgi:hypothetical protein
VRWPDEGGGEVSPESAGVAFPLLAAHLPVNERADAPLRIAELFASMGADKSAPRPVWLVHCLVLRTRNGMQESK